MKRSCLVLIMMVSGLPGAGLVSVSAAQGEIGNQAARDQPPVTPADTAPGYPHASGKGPGSGHSYRQGSAGPGQGSPNYRGGRDAQTALAVDTPTNGVKNDAPTTEVQSDAQPVRAVDATTREVTKDAGPAIPGPYGIPPRPGYPYNTGSGYPYSGGRGRGYGRTRHGYGTGYPGYRGLGGGRYPHHRQFGNPPLYPAQPAVSDPSTVTE